MILIALRKKKRSLGISKIKSMETNPFSNLLNSVFQHADSLNFYPNFVSFT